MGGKKKTAEESRGKEWGGVGKKLGPAIKREEKGVRGPKTGKAATIGKSDPEGQQHPAKISSR